MNRTTRIAAVVVASALTMGAVAMPAHAARGNVSASASANVEARVDAAKSVAVAKRITVAHVKQVDARLDAYTKVAKRLEADVRAEVRANIAADQEALVDLVAEARAAVTKDAVVDVAAQVADYRPQVYKQVIADLKAAARLQDKIDDQQGSVSLNVSVTVGLAEAQRHLDAAVEGAVALNADSTRSESRAVKADLAAAAKAYAEATN